jgi:hypothetical protein
MAAEPSVVYLIRSGRSHKIGHTKNLPARLVKLRTDLPGLATVVYQLRTHDPVGFENYLHYRFAPSRRRGEWFRLTPADLAEIRGITEWPTSTIDTSHVPPRARRRSTHRQPVTCSRCGHTWVPYGRKIPKKCANKSCATPYWRKRRQGEDT